MVCAFGPGTELEVQIQLTSLIQLLRQQVSDISMRVLDEYMICIHFDLVELTRIAVSLLRRKVYGYISKVWCWLLGMAQVVQGQLNA
jgi:hypothetical protein